MKKLVSILAVATIMTACSNNKSDQEQTKETKTEEAKTTERKEIKKKTEEKVTTEAPTTEKPTTEAPQETSNGPKSYITKNGEIDVLSDAFIKDYFFKNNIDSFGGITKGMPISEVEQLYGKSKGPGVAMQYPTTGRFGDFALDYPDGKVTTILINPHEVITSEQILKAYGQPTEIIKYQNNQFIYDANKNNGYSVIVGFDHNWNLVVIYQIPEDEEQVNTRVGLKAYTEKEKMEMVQEFMNWADERAKIGKMAVTDRYFTHGAAGFGDWYAETPNGEVQAQDNGKPGFKSFDKHAIGGIVFYTPVSGNYGVQDEMNKASTAEGYSKFAKKGTNLHKYMLVDDGIVYELIADYSDMSFSTGFGERNDDGSLGEYKPNHKFEVSGDQAAQQEWKRILQKFNR